MRFLNKYLVVALFVVGLISSSGFVIDSRCSAATVCPECKKEHEGRCAKHVCTKCGITHEGRCAPSTQARGKAATFKAAFTGAGASRVGSLTSGLSLIQSQAANMVSSNFTPYSYGYNGN
ncbi:MAG: hypothetical protein HW390_1058 [Candidatus Brocadiaceae bacterium]|nr:hypothetical protein [Candidatus Brocadiaceae bacterium]